MTAALEGGELSAAHPGRTLRPGNSRYPFYRRLGGPQGRSRRAENLAPTGIRFRTVQPVAESLYRLSYPVHNNNNNNNNNNNKAEILKYKDHTLQIQRMWNVKTKVIPVIIGAIGTVSESFRKYVSNIPGKHEVKELQKTVILGTAHILRKVLM